MRDVWKSLILFWKKIDNDWVPNLSALLAYNFLMATFPLLLLLLAIVGFGFGLIDPKAEHDLLTNLSNTFPMFGILFLIIPSRRPQWAHLWPGTLVASLLLVLYEKIFPLYTGLIVRPSNFGSIAGLAIVIVIFYYFLAFILLLGAELNSWLAGNRASVVALTATFYGMNGPISPCRNHCRIEKINANR